MIDAVLAVPIGLIAALYSSVGLAGATGYLAVMALAGVPAEAMKPSALLLNSLVAGVGAIQHGRAGHRPRGLVGPILLASVPMAFLGGALHLPSWLYLPMVGAIMLLAAWRMLRLGGPGWPWGPASA